MSEAPIKRDKDENLFVAKVMRNFLSVVGLLCFVVFPLLEAHSDGPYSWKPAVISFSMAVGLLMLFGASVAERLRRKILSGEVTDVDFEVTRSEGMSMPEVLFVMAVGAICAVGILWFFSQVEQSKLAAQLAPNSMIFDMSTAKPAEDLFDILHYPAERSVVVKASNVKSARDVACAVNASGDLEILTLHKMVGETSLTKVKMNDELDAAAAMFCDTAFVRAGYPAIAAN